MPPVQTPYQSRHDHSWRASTLWDRYIRTQGFTIPDPLYKSSKSQKRVKKPKRYAATPEERHHQELLAMMDHPTNGRMLTRGLLWEDHGPKPQIPKGYVLNEGADYIPFDIRLPSGEMKPAKYIKVEYGEDPLVYGMIDGDHHQYVKSFQATPFPSAGPLRTYTSGQLEFFKDDHDLRPEVDSAVYHLYDKSALAEVECYRINKKKLKREYEELRQVQHDIWKRELTIGGCA